MTISHIKSIFVPFISVESGLPASVRVAASLAKAAGAHVAVRAIGQRIVLPYSIAGEFAAAYLDTANNETRARAEADAEAAERLLDGAAASLDVQTHLLAHDGLMSLAAGLARAYDIAVVDRIGDNLSEGRAMIEELLFASGRPALVVPPHATAFKAARIVIAWDGGPRAARAVNDALPFLKAAAHVEIVCITNEKELKSAIPGAELAPNLVRHGVKAEVVNLTAPDRSAARAIRERAELTGADMIVLGAYAHPRWRQWMMGGVTDSMLNHSETTLFMSY